MAIKNLRKNRCKHCNFDINRFKNVMIKQIKSKKKALYDF